jgi:hypothetical protein
MLSECRNNGTLGCCYQKTERITPVLIFSYADFQMCISLGDSGIGDIIDLVRQWVHCVQPEDQWILAAFNAIYVLSQRSVCVLPVVWVMLFRTPGICSCFHDEKSL